MIFNNKTYDVLKFVALIALPAIAAFYAGFGQLWEFPETDRVVTSIVLVDTLLGALLQLSSKQYNSNVIDAGYLAVPGGQDPDTGLPDLQLTVNQDPNKIAENKIARFKIQTPPGGTPAGP